MKQQRSGCSYTVTVLVLFILSCSGTERPLTRPVRKTDHRHVILIVNRGYHTGIILDRSDASEHISFLAPPFSRYSHVDIGWGDREFYIRRGFSYLYAARALFIPTESVLRVEGFNADIVSAASWNRRSVFLYLSDDEFSRLCLFINRTVSKGPAGKAEVELRKHSGIIYFKSPLKYHLLMTCNTWTAEALNHAGLPVSTSAVITAEALFKRIDKNSRK